MAISTDNAIKAMLKTYYKKEGLSNLLFRNSPLLKKIKKDTVEGKSQNFAAMLKSMILKKVKKFEEELEKLL